MRTRTYLLVLAILALGLIAVVMPGRPAVATDEKPAEPARFAGPGPLEMGETLVPEGARDKAANEALKLQLAREAIAAAEAAGTRTVRPGSDPVARTTADAEALKHRRLAEKTPVPIATRPGVPEDGQATATLEGSESARKGGAR